MIALKHSSIYSTPFKNKVGIVYSFICVVHTRVSYSTYSHTVPEASKINGPAVMPIGESSINYYDPHCIRPNKSLPYSKIYLVED